MIQKEKLAQAIMLLQELDIDMWLTFVRETPMNSDPVMPLISSIDYTASTGIIVTKSKTIVLAGHNDAEGARQINLYDEVISYEGSFDKAFTDLLRKLNPKEIAVNYSKGDVAADGLTFGMYQRLTEILENAEYTGKLISSEAIIGKLRGRKSQTERERILQAIQTTEKIFEDARGFIREGVTEIDIFNFFHERMKHYGVTPSWQASQCPGVMLGPLSVPGHNGPTEIVGEKGDVMDIDFGVLENEYCSDLQRIYYILEDGETKANEEVQRAFDTIQEGIRRAVAFMKPGVLGSEVDAVAREYIMSQGYPSWNYALGHQVGRLAHDGGVVLAPRWDRYKEREEQPIEEGMVFTLEPGIATSRGYVGQEEMVIVEKDGAVFLSEQQKGIYLV